VELTPLNQTTGLVGFLFVAFDYVVWLTSSFLTAIDLPRKHRLAILLLVGIFSFIVGVALSTANVAWALLRK
jgi:multisubunit Na+/H+ antiporter MnhE subunit